MFGRNGLMNNKKKVIKEYEEGWIIWKEENFPSSNYAVFNRDRLSPSDAERFRNGIYPKRGVAYCGTLNSAIRLIEREILEDKI